MLMSEYYKSISNITHINVGRTRQARPNSKLLLSSLCLHYNIQRLYQDINLLVQAIGDGDGVGALRTV